mmetsp:Transcript_12350/g.18998  ORF Transcript_12350/g.18998 Transcript_12350/m.18998 type:complete len:98 (+) Transcript_12350:209-502(+)
MSALPCKARPAHAKSTLTPAAAARPSQLESPPTGCIRLIDVCVKHEGLCLCRAHRRAVPHPKSGGMQHVQQAGLQLFMQRGVYHHSRWAFIQAPGAK